MRSDERALAALQPKFHRYCVRMVDSVIHTKSIKRPATGHRPDAARLQQTLMNAIGRFARAQRS